MTTDAHIADESQEMMGLALFGYHLSPVSLFHDKYSSSWEMQTF